MCQVNMVFNQRCVMPNTQQSANNFFDHLCKDLIWIQSFHAVNGKNPEQTSDGGYEECVGWIRSDSGISEQ